ncbi:MAG: PHP domain-containing protein, partial [Actinomycetales bacterium]
MTNWRPLLHQLTSAQLTSMQLTRKARPMSSSPLTPAEDLRYDWPHLRVASRASLQYGTAAPERIAARAAADGHRMIALTDRDGLYGAVQWAQACQAHGLAAIIGVDLAVEQVVNGGTATQATRRRTPAHGGRWVDERRPRVVLLAHGSTGWAALCRVVSAAHGSHADRGEPWLRLADLAEHAHGLIALLGSDSEIGRHLAGRHVQAANQALVRWQQAMG